VLQSYILNTHCSFIYQVASARRQRSDLYGLRVQVAICSYLSNYSKIEAIS